MAKHVIDPENLSWPATDEDDSILLIVMQAFTRVFPGTQDVSIYHMIFHDTNMDRWTAYATATGVDDQIHFHEIYYSGKAAIFVNMAPKPTNTNIRGWL